MKRWKFNEIAEIVVKCTNSVKKACEVYFHSFHSVLFSFKDQKQLNQFVYKVKTIHSHKPEIKIRIVEDPDQYIIEGKYRENWIKGELSNFEYLMALNKYGGRSFNDINQYPIFPWIISDYETEMLDRSNDSIFRDLSKPMAGISEEKVNKLNEEIAKYNASTKNFLQSIDKCKKETYSYQLMHYLPASVVVEYLVRLEPFYTMQISTEFFDYKKGLKQSIKEIWDSITTSIENNSELVPEFYYLPEMFDNHNNGIFEVKNINDQLFKSYQLILPSWARDPHIFVQENLLALESMHTSLQLNKWIDLIFGEKQQDIKYYNFYNTIAERLKFIPRNSTPPEFFMKSIASEGQVPMKLFNEKHPEVNEKLINNKRQYSIFDYYKGNDAKTTFVNSKIKEFEPNKAVIFIKSFEKKAFAIIEGQKLYKSKEGCINNPSEKSILFIDKGVALFPSRQLFSNEKKNYIDVQRCFDFIDDSLISCRYFDNSWRVSSCSTGKVTDVLKSHKATVNCVCVIAKANKIVTGSNDGILAIWEVGSSVFGEPKLYLTGHNFGIISIDVCEQLGLITTAEAEGLIIFREISNGKFVNLIKLKVNKRSSRISHVRLLYRGYVLIIVKTNDIDRILVYNINGERICVIQVKESINAIVLSENGYEFIVGGTRGMLLKYDVITLKEENMWNNLESKEGLLNQDESLSITSLNLTIQEGVQQLLIGTNKGELWTYKFQTNVV